MVLTTQSNNGRRVAQGASANSQLVSDANNNYQKKLLHDLVEARRLRGRTVEEVAQLLHATAEVIEDIESGDYEPNLTELRQYAYAIEAVVEFRVHACAAEALSTFRGLMSHRLLNDNLWVNAAASPWSDAIHDLTAASAVLEIVQAER